MVLLVLYTDFFFIDSILRSTAETTSLNRFNFVSGMKKASQSYFRGRLNSAIELTKDVGAMHIFCKTFVESCIFI